MLLAFFLPANLQAQPQIFYEATDLADTTVGRDLWQVSYTVTGYTFTTNQGWTTYFPAVNYDSLIALPSPSSADWNVLAVQPDTILNEPGFYDALALRTVSSPTAQFDVTFVWLGSGTPGAQAFTTYDRDFTTMFSGQTIAVVPEPGGVGLAALGLALLWGAQRFRRNKLQE